MLHIREREFMYTPVKICADLEGPFETLFQKIVGKNYIWIFTVIQKGAKCQVCVCSHPQKYVFLKTTNQNIWKNQFSYSWPWYWEHSSLRPVGRVENFHFKFQAFVSSRNSIFTMMWCSLFLFLKNYFLFESWWKLYSSDHPIKSLIP